jgi:hypothetical protein
MHRNIRIRVNRHSLRNAMCESLRGQRSADHAIMVASAMLQLYSIEGRKGTCHAQPLLPFVFMHPLSVERVLLHSIMNRQRCLQRFFCSRSSATWDSQPPGMLTASQWMMSMVASVWWQPSSHHWHVAISLVSIGRKRP